MYSARDLVRVPGLLSLSRLVLAALFALAVHRVAWAVGALAAAGLSDVLDGWYARRFGQATMTGALLDAVVDKVFVGAVVLTLVLTHLLSVPEALLLGVRDVGELAIGGRLLVRAPAQCWRPHAPHALGKLTTGVQYATVLAALVRSPARPWFALLAGAVGALATLAYVRQERV